MPLSLPAVSTLLPALYLVPTPIGNLDDITRRALSVLQSVPWVAAEDTRHTAPLLKHYGVTARLLPAHEHNELEAAQRIIACLQAGEAVALVTDAGTPGISDPGARIVTQVRAAGLSVVPLPGPCAAITALSGSGFQSPHFLFYGFLPAKAGQRRQVLQDLATAPYTLIFYEAPHRILETVQDIIATLGPARPMLLAKELTKHFETLHAASAAAVLDWLQAEPVRQKGEFVLLLEGAVADNNANPDAERILRLLLAEGLPVKQCAKLAATISGAGKNELYALALRLKAADDE